MPGRIVELANARVIQRGDGPCFPFAPFCELCVENPDGDDTIDASVAGFLSHETSARKAENLVRPTFAADRKTYAF